jgi:nicotinate-nucleotide pyrophosphorylase (carboxylating)
VVCGYENLEFTVVRGDASHVGAGDLLATVVASTQDLLVGERTALNLLCHLSGVASATGRWVTAVEGTGAVIRDTRKTTPGLRALEKYAVRCGGGANHRMSLSDAILIKDNHVAAAGGVKAAFEQVRRVADDLAIEIEVDTLDQLREVLDAGADLVLLDNMDVATMRAAVDVAHSYERTSGRMVLLEASGGLSLQGARIVAETGVHFISVGALTHSSPILDIGLDFVGA